MSKGRRILIWAAATLMGGLVTSFPLAAVAVGEPSTDLSVGQVATNPAGEEIDGDANKLYAGEVVEYTFVVSNSASSDAEDVTLTLTPSGLLDSSSLESCDPQSADCTLLENFDTHASDTPLPLETIAAGTPDAPTSKSFVFRARVLSDALPGDITNTVSLSWTDANAAKKSAEILLSTPVDALADISVSQVAKNTAGKVIGASNKIRAGQVITYVATIKNAGPSSARNVKVKNTFDSGVTDLRSCLSACSAGSAFRSYRGSEPVSLGALAAGSTKTVSFRGKLPSSITAAREISNVVSAKSYKTDAVASTADSDSGDATSTITTTVYKARSATTASNNNQPTTNTNDTSISSTQNIGVYLGNIGAPTYFKPQLRTKTVVVKKVYYSSAYGRGIPPEASAPVVDAATSTTQVVPVASTIVRAPQEVWLLLPVGLLLIIWITYLVLEPYEDQILASRPVGDPIALDL